jgi:hypothetical protein
MRGLGITLFISYICLALASCGPKAPDPGANQAASKDACKAIGRQFAEAMIAKDWTAARALGTKDYQATHTIEQMQAGYDAVANQILKDEPAFKPTVSQIDSGDLPHSYSEAEQVYGIPKAGDMSTWRGWIFAIVGVGKPDEVDHGLEARLFIVEEEGKLKFAYVEFALLH